MNVRQCRFGIHLVGRWREDNIGSGRFGKFEIALKRTRVGIEIFTCPELKWVDKNRERNDVAIVCGSTKERQVPFMQCAHGWHQSNRTPKSAHRFEVLAKF
jgi:hypothetical protein